jgi:hypothetical protein
VFHFSRTASGYPAVPFVFPAGIAAVLSGYELDALALFVDGAGKCVAVSNVDRVRVR